MSSCTISIFMDIDFSKYLGFGLTESLHKVFVPSNMGHISRAIMDLDHNSYFIDSIDIDDNNTFISRDEMVSYCSITDNSPAAIDLADCIICHIPQSTVDDMIREVCSNSTKVISK